MPGTGHVLRNDFATAAVRRGLVAVLRANVIAMPRPPRVQFPGAHYHVTTRANRSGTLFLDEYDRKVFAYLVALIVDEHEWECFAWCLMTTHYHLLFSTPRGDLAAGMHRINSRYADWFNQRHVLRGHVFERRYHATLIESDEHLLTAYRYVALNPVKAGACRAPAEWKWSSYAEAITGIVWSPIATENLHCHFGSGARGRDELRRFVEAPDAHAAIRDVAGAWHRARTKRTRAIRAHPALLLSSP